MVQENSLKKIIIIAGPTCSGKSKIALDLAGRINGAIISADSMQIYKEMNIGTAKTMPDEYNNIPHYLIDIIKPDQEFSVAEYNNLAEKAIIALNLSGKYPIVAGGTGLYINSLIYPMTFGKADKNEELRNILNKELIEFGSLYIHDKLKAIDPAAAERLHPNDTRRIIRAIEIASVSNKTMTESKDKPEPIREYLMIGLDIERDVLYNRINERVENMFDSGLIEEVNSLRNKYSFGIQSMQAIGYKEFKEYFDGSIDIVCLKELIKKNTRNYAKRQMTWFRKYDNIKWFNPENQYEEIFENIMRNI